MTQLGACPCLHTTPCHERCACVMPFSSSGCSRCCSYGSPAQQKAMAEMIAAQIARSNRMSVAELASALPEGARLVFRVTRVEGAPFLTASIFQHIEGAPDLARAGVSALEVREEDFADDVEAMVKRYAGVQP